MRICKLLLELKECKQMVDILETRFKNGELEKEDLKYYLGILNQYLDILEKDVENI